MLTDLSEKAVKALKHENLKLKYENLGRRVSVTEEHFDFPSHCSVADMDWNHMDQGHRSFIHKTYQEAMRITSGENFAVSLTKLPPKVFKIPLLIMVTDVKVGPGLFYQFFNLFSVIHVHNVIQFYPEKSRVNWYIVSHPIFKLLHFVFSRKYNKLLREANEEDVPIRKKRAELRSKGFHFNTDNPNFINSNTFEDGIIFPKLKEIYRIFLKNLSQKKINEVEAGPIKFLVELNGKNEVMIWPQVCPHQGGPLLPENKCGKKIKCPWHGLSFSGVSLNPVQPYGDLINGQIHFHLNQDELLISSEPF